MCGGNFNCYNDLVMLVTFNAQGPEVLNNVQNKIVPIAQPLRNTGRTLYPKSPRLETYHLPLPDGTNYHF